MDGNMVRRHKVDEIHLEVTGFIPFRNGQGAGFVIEWSSDIGFGEYTVYKNHKDEELMKLFIDKLMIKE